MTNHARRRTRPPVPGQHQCASANRRIEVRRSGTERICNRSYRGLTRQLFPVTPCGLPKLMRTLESAKRPAATRSFATNGLSEAGRKRARSPSSVVAGAYRGRQRHTPPVTNRRSG